MRRRTASGVSLTEAVSAADDRAGIGPLAETTLYAWMGDVRRFPNAKTLAAYAGLVPSVRQSGGVASYGEITKQGCGALRATLVHAAHGVLLYRCQTAEAAPLQAIGTRIRTSRGRRKIAVRGGTGRPAGRLSTVTDDRTASTAGVGAAPLPRAHARAGSLPCHSTPNTRCNPERPFSSSSRPPSKANSSAPPVSSRTSDDTRISPLRAAAPIRAATITLRPKKS